MEQHAEEFVVKSAGFWIRFFAYVVDVCLIWAVLRLLIVHNLFQLLNISDAKIWFVSIESLVASILFFAYFVCMTKWFNQTLGKMIFGIRVVSDSGEPLTWTTVLIREWIGRYISVVIKVLYVIVAFTPNHKAIHDYIADTRVVYENAYAKIKTEELAPITQLKQLQDSREV